MNGVKELRQKLGLSQDAFAAKLGIAPYTVRRWEAGGKIGNIAKRLIWEIFRVEIK